MSTFCGGSSSGAVPAMTLTELQAVYPNTNRLVREIPDMTNGLASEEWVRAHVLKLAGEGVIPDPGKASEVQSNPGGAPDALNPLTSFVEKENTLQDSIRAEYCFYEKRYFSALDGFLQAIADASLKNNSQNTVNQKLDLARTLNKKVILITQIANGIAKYRYTTSSQFQTDINSLNGKLRERATSLIEQNKILMRESAAADVNTRMVEYTLEKNKANQNLLTLYGILNVVAFSMIFYIARS
jgi:hypothetical protein